MATGNQKSWCDATLRSIQWAPEAGSLTLAFHDGLNQPRTIRFEHAHAVNIALTNPLGNAAPPMTWDATFEQHSDHDWTVTFDFAAQGTITVRCSAFAEE